MKPQSFGPLQPKTVLGIAAHPDDLDFSAGGTLATFAAQGAAVHYLQVTDGCKGTNDPDCDCETVAKRRAVEQEQACQAIGGKDVHFLNYVDGELVVSNELKKQLVRAIRTLKPEVVITTDPTVMYSMQTGMINHSDHRACGEAVLDAVYPLARDRLAYEDLLEDEGLAPHKVETILLINHDVRNYFIDVTEAIDAKLAAIKAHASQFPDYEQMKNMLLQIAIEDGKRADCRFAEGFVRLEMMR
jgi:LmbE family N-acetylglucosaminyl deacetylase